MTAAAEERDAEGFTPAQRAHQEAVSQGANDFMDSMTGFDFIACKKAFGESVADADFLTNVIQFAFVMFRRDGETDAEAYDHAMKLPAKAVRQLMVDYGGQPDLGELFGETPETPQGKGDSATVTKPPS